MIKTNKLALLALLAGLTTCGELPMVGESRDRNEGIESIAYSSKPDFRVITDVSQKKTAFFEYLRPAVEHENKRVEKERQFLLQIQSKFESGKDLNSKEQDYAVKLGEMYQVESKSGSVSSDWFAQMLNRVDVLPEELVLSQAANESGWGTSRFAVEGNNYFGQWCYRKGCGLVPSSRSEGATHEVAVYDSAYLSVQAYFMNVNRNRAYADIRKIREAHREAGEMLEGIKLAEGLGRYSERGHAYVDEIQAMIRHNNKYWRQG